jgi:hypothetical protein
LLAPRAIVRHATGQSLVLPERPTPSHRFGLATKEANMNIFSVGMPAICVDDDGWPKTSNLPNKPVRGCVYTIRYVGINRIGEIGVRLHNHDKKQTDTLKLLPAFYD